MDGMMDYPHPPHHYKQFTTPTAMPPPDIAAISAMNPEFFALGALERFDEGEEKVTPNYLADKRLMIR
jgi:hypothetical protein